jgi:hypothetical protein
MKHKGIQEPRMFFTHFRALCDDKGDPPWDENNLVFEDDEVTCPECLKYMKAGTEPDKKYKFKIIRKKVKTFEKEMEFIARDKEEAIEQAKKISMEENFMVETVEEEDEYSNIYELDFIDEDGRKERGSLLARSSDISREEKEKLFKELSKQMDEEYGKNWLEGIKKKKS